MENNMEFQPKRPAQPMMTFNEVSTPEEVETQPRNVEPQYEDAQSNFVTDSLSELENLLDEVEGTEVSEPIVVEENIERVQKVEIEIPATKVEVEQPDVEEKQTPSNVTTLNNTKANIADLLKNATIDLNNLEISTGSVMDLQRTHAMFNDAPTMQVTCCQSAYTAQISALRSQEITNLTESDSDLYTFRKKITQTAHKHIETTSIGKMNYPTFMKYTSYYDFETILYGIYCQTFPSDNKYNVRCPASDCGKTISVTANNYTLVETRGKDEALKRVDDVVRNVRSPKDIIEKSLLSKVKRVCLDETKFIVDVHIPTIENYLEGILGKVTPKQAEEYSSSLGLALFIQALYVPNLAVLKQTGKLEYFKVEDKMEIVKYIGDILPYDDALQLTEFINEFTEQYRVHYSIKDVQCNHCGHIIENIPLDMEELLFRTVRQGRRRKEENNEQNM